MQIAGSVVRDENVVMKNFSLSILLLVMLVSGCSTLANSARFYQDNPPRRGYSRHCCD